MFIGTYYHSLDEKQRVAVPKTFREEIGRGSVLTHGLDGCLFLFPAESWSLLASKLQTLPLGQKGARDFLRLLSYNATPAEFDKLGRTHLTDSLVKLAGIQKDVVFAGALTRVEVWAKERYHTYIESLEGHEDELEKTMGELGI